VLAVARFRGLCLDRRARRGGALRLPAHRRLGAFADDECILAFDAFVGSDIDHSDLDFTSIIPSRAAWDGGDRTILCALWQYDGDPMVGSARGTDR
jgi:Septum formation